MGENAAAGQRCGQRCAVLRDDGAHVPASMLCAAGAAPKAHLCHLQAPRRPFSRRPRRQAPHVDRPDARSRRQAAAWTHWAPRYSDKWPDSCQRGPFDAQRHVRAPQTVHPLALRAALHAHARARVLPTGTSVFLSFFLLHVTPQPTHTRTPTRKLTPTHIKVHPFSRWLPRPGLSADYGAWPTSVVLARAARHSRRSCHRAIPTLLQRRGRAGEPAAGRTRRPARWYRGTRAFKALGRSLGSRHACGSGAGAGRRRM